MKYWKQPKENAWFTFIVDGKRLSAVEDSTKTQKEIKRVRHLAGVSVVESSSQDLIKANAKTVIPKRIINKINSLLLAKNSKFK